MLEQIIAATCPFPLVDLGSPRTPRRGISIPCPKHCPTPLEPNCLAHYSALRQVPPGTPVPCPGGFASIPFRLGERLFAATGLVLFPRLGSPKERARAKQYPRSHVATADVLEWVKASGEELGSLGGQVRAALSSHMEAFHEVRRLNQVVKGVMERVCMEERPGDPETATPDLVRAWKASELISHQLDALDLLANPHLVDARPNKPVVFYKIVDKVFRIYKPGAVTKGVTLRLTGRSDAKALVYDGTIHIAPSAFIDNAIKYSPRGGDIEVRVFGGARDNVPYVGFEVVSQGPCADSSEEAALFRERGRGSAAKKQAEGSGVGLVLVSAVARQHGAHVSKSQRRISDTMSEWTFAFEIPTHG